MPATTPPPQPDPARSTAGAAVDSLDDAIAAALSAYQAERIARRPSAELDDGPPSELQIDDAIGRAVDALEAAGESAAALCLVYVAAYRTKPTGLMREALLSIAVAGPEPMGFGAAARAASVAPYARTTPSGRRRWGAPMGLRTGDPVRHRGTGPVLQIVALGTTDWAESTAAVARPGVDGVEWLPVADLVAAPRPTIEPMGPAPASAEEGGAS